MISRRTIVALLLALGLGLGIRLWALDVRDDCDRYGPGTVVKAVSGTRSVDVPCARWAWPLRQSERVQALLLLDLVLGVAFVVFLGADWVGRRDGRKGAA